MNDDLFDSNEASGPPTTLAEGAMVLKRFAADYTAAVIAELEAIFARAPLRHLVTPGGQIMSVAMTNCGQVGWVSDRRGYRYDSRDPETGHAWPSMPASFHALATAAAQAAGYARFAPDACLINRYVPGARLTPHQDKNERNYAAPIVSVSLGLPAKFRFGGARRKDPAAHIVLRHGDVAVWGGVSRLAFHGVDALPDGLDPVLGRCRINLTFREAL